MVKLYIPIEHVPAISVPGFWLPRAISVLPVAGKFRRIPRLGIVKAELQSKVFWVFTLKIVSLFAAAMITEGE